MLGFLPHNVFRKNVLFTIGYRMKTSEEPAEQVASGVFISIRNGICQYTRNDTKAMIMCRRSYPFRFLEETAQKCRSADKIKQIAGSALTLPRQSKLTDWLMCDVRNRIKLGIQQGSGITDAVIRANPRPNEVHGCMEYAKLYSTMYYDEINRQIAYYQKILDQRKEEMNNDTQQQQLNDEYFHGIQLQLEDLYLQSRKGRGHQ